MLEPYTEQQTGSKLGKECVQAVHCHPAYLTYMQSTSSEMLGWMNHKLESILLREISTILDMHMIPNKYYLEGAVKKRQKSSFKNTQEWEGVKMAEQEDVEFVFPLRYIKNTSINGTTAEGEILQNSF